MDFDGLFGNIGSVIDLSERLFETLQDSDSIGNKIDPRNLRMEEENIKIIFLFKVTLYSAFRKGISRIQNGAGGGLQNLLPKP